MKKYYVLVIWDDIEPEIIGPFKTEICRDDRAIDYKMQYDDAHGIYRCISYNGSIKIESYPASFFMKFCRFCGIEHEVVCMHRHQDHFVCDECWDNRLETTS